MAEGASRVASLRLQLIDAISGPALAVGKNIGATDKALSKFGKDAKPAFQRLQQELDKLKAKSAAISEFREAKKGLHQLGQELTTARGRFEQLRQAFAQNPTGRLKSEMTSARSVLQNVAAALKGQAEAARQAQSGLSRYGVSVRTLRNDALNTESAIQRLQKRINDPLRPVEPGGGIGGVLPGAVQVGDGEHGPQAEGKPGGRRRGGGLLSTTSGRLIAAVGAYAGVGTIYGAGKGALVDFAEQDRALSRIMITAEASSKRKSEVLRKLTAVALKTGLPFGDVLKALEAQVGQGETLDKALSGLDPIATTAQASGGTSEDVAKTTYGLRHAMGIGDSELQGGFDRLVKGGKVGSFEAKDSAQYLPSILPLAATLGYHGNTGLSKIIAALQVVRSQTGDSSSAATNLENLISKVYSEETANKFKDFGIDLPGLMDRSRKEGLDPLSTVVAATKTATGGDLSKLPLLFQDMQAQAAIRALVQNFGDYRKLSTEIDNAGGSTLEDFGKVADDTASRIENVTTAWERLKSSIGGTAASYANPILKVLADQLQKSDEQDAALAGQDQPTRKANRREFIKRWTARHPNAWPWSANQAYGDALARAGRGEGSIWDDLPAVADPIRPRPLSPAQLAAMEADQKQFGGVHFEGGWHRVGLGAGPAPADPMAGIRGQQQPQQVDVAAPISVSVTLTGVHSDEVLAQAREAAQKAAMAAIDAFKATLGVQTDRAVARARQTTLTGGPR